MKIKIYNKLASKSRGPLRRRWYNGMCNANAVIEDMIDHCWRAIRCLYVIVTVMAAVLLLRAVKARTAKQMK